MDDSRKTISLVVAILIFCLLVVYWVFISPEEQKEMRGVDIRSNIPEQDDTETRAYMQGGSTPFMASPHEKTDATHSYEEELEMIEEVAKNIREQSVPVLARKDEQSEEQFRLDTVRPMAETARRQARPKSPKPPKSSGVPGTPLPPSAVEIMDTIVSSPPRTFKNVVLHERSMANAIRAYVHTDQMVMVGSILKMRTSSDCHTDDGKAIPRGTPVYGEVRRIDAERVIVEISSIQIGGSLYPFEKDVYSRDAIIGIYVPGNTRSEINTEVSGSLIPSSVPVAGGSGDIASRIAKETANSAISGVSQALGRQVRKVRVMIKTNYELLLTDAKKRQLK